MSEDKQFRELIGKRDEYKILAKKFEILKKAVISEKKTEKDLEEEIEKYRGEL